MAAGIGRPGTYLAVAGTVCFVAGPAFLAFVSACFEMMLYPVFWFASTICFITSRFPYLAKTTPVAFAGMSDDEVSVSTRIKCVPAGFEISKTLGSSDQGLIE